MLLKLHHYIQKHGTSPLSTTFNFSLIYVANLYYRQDSPIKDTQIEFTVSKEYSSRIVKVVTSCKVDWVAFSFLKILKMGKIVGSQQNSDILWNFPNKKKFNFMWPQQFALKVGKEGVLLIYIPKCIVLTDDSDDKLKSNVYIILETSFVSLFISYPQ